MRPEKQLLLDEMKERVDSPYGIVLTSYEKMDANLTANFRTNIVKLGGSFLAVRKRVFFKAAKEAGFELEDVGLDGHLGVFVTGENIVAATKALCEFKDDNKGTLNILGGRYEGKACTADEIIKISKLPTHDEMRAQFLGLLEAPMANVLSVMEALLTSVPYCLENKEEQTNT